MTILAASSSSSGKAPVAASTAGRFLGGAEGPPGPPGEFLCSSAPGWLDRVLLELVDARLAMFIENSNSRRERGEDALPNS